MVFRFISSMLLSLIFISSIASSNSNLITQGEINITLDDIDGFSYTIPKEDRAGFFNSPDRIDQTLKSMVTMKHIVNYAELNNLLDLEIINKDISLYLLDNAKTIEGYNLNAIEYLKLKKFIFNKIAYKYMHGFIRESVDKENLSDLAYEQYILDKEVYYLKDELRTLQYITIKFDKNSKEKHRELANTLLTELKDSQFTDIESNYKDNESVIFTVGINDFYYNKKYEKFSDFVFKPNSIGVINGVLEGEKTFIIVELLNITKAGYKPYDTVKDKILITLKNEKSKLKFGDLVSQLTQDKITVNEDGIISLKNRYISKK